jgi:hypothetical protein
MNAVRGTGLLISAIGLVLVLNFFTRQVNPDVQGADLGMLAVLLGLLIVGYDSLRERAGGHGATSAPLVSAGWPILSAGLLIALASFLLENQVMCSCPAFGPCACGTAYDLMFHVGAFIAVAGMILVTIGYLHARPSSTSGRTLVGSS